MKKAKDQPESEPAELASLVGERIRKIRKEEGLSLELFALRCDMNAAYVGHIERGVQNPTLNTLERICKGLDISVEDLFMDKNATVDTALSELLSEVPARYGEQAASSIDSPLLLLRSRALPGLHIRAAHGAAA